MKHNNKWVTMINKFTWVLFTLLILFSSLAHSAATALSFKEIMDVYKQNGSSYLEYKITLKRLDELSGTYKTVPIIANNMGVNSIPIKGTITVTDSKRNTLLVVQLTHALSTYTRQELNGIARIEKPIPEDGTVSVGVALSLDLSKMDQEALREATNSALSGKKIPPKQKSKTFTTKKPIGPKYPVLQKKCEKGLVAYERHRHVNIVSEYKNKTGYFYRANYDIKRHGVNTIQRIGWNCEIYYIKGEEKVMGMPRNHPYADVERVKKGSLASKLPEHRVFYGGSACPRLETWKKFTDEMLAENYSAIMPNECLMIQNGDKILGPLKTEKYRNFPFVLIVLPNNKQYWVEGVMLEKKL